VSLSLSHTTRRNGDVVSHLWESPKHGNSVHSSSSEKRACVVCVCVCVCLCLFSLSSLVHSLIHSSTRPLARSLLSSALPNYVHYSLAKLTATSEKGVCPPLRSSSSSFSFPPSFFLSLSLFLSHSH